MAMALLIMQNLQFTDELDEQETITELKCVQKEFKQVMMHI